MAIASMFERDLYIPVWSVGLGFRVDGLMAWGIWFRAARQGSNQNVHRVFVSSQKSRRGGTNRSPSPLQQKRGSTPGTKQFFLNGSQGAGLHPLTLKLLKPDRAESSEIIRTKPGCSGVRIERFRIWGSGQHERDTPPPSKKRLQIISQTLILNSASPCLDSLQAIKK